MKELRYSSINLDNFTCQLFLLIILLNFNLLPGQNSQQVNPLTHQFEELTEEYLDLNTEATGVIASVDVLNKIRWHYSTGSVGINSSEQPKGDELFIAASITKMFVSVCILQLQEEGLLSIDDLVADYIDKYIIKDLTEYNGKSTENKLTMAH